MADVATAVVFEDRALVREAWARPGRSRAVHLEPQAERVLRRLEESGVPYAVITTGDADGLAADLAELCTYPDAVVETEAATSRLPWLAAVGRLGARADTSIALISTDDANWAAGQAGLSALYPSSFDVLPRMIGVEAPRPLSEMWAALRRPGGFAERRRRFGDAFTASALAVTREFTRTIAA